MLQRGYGDSHDLARLVAALLRRVGIESQVALANSRGVPLDASLPSPFLLDAALVSARSGTTDYWLNPVAPGPVTVLGTTDPADLRRALLLAPTDGRLVTLPRPAPDSRLHRETQQFDLRQGNAQAASLTLISRFQGSWAQSQRAALLAQSPAQRDLSQVQSVAQDYPAAIAGGATQLEDLPEQQAVQLTGRFRIPQPFGAGADPQFAFFAEVLTDAVQPRDEPTRRLPLALPWPLALEEHIEAALPVGWTVTPGTLVIENPAFRYRRDVRFANGTLHIDHRYVALADRVAAADYPQFLKANAEVYAALGLKVQAPSSAAQRLLDALAAHWLSGVGLAALAGVGITALLRRRRT